MLPLLFVAVLSVSDAGLPPQVSRVQPDGRFLIMVGEEITLELNERLEPKIVFVRPADSAAILSMPPVRRDGRVRLTLAPGPNNTRVLKVESGFPRDFDYGAVFGIRLGAGVGLETTSTCTVRNGLYALENWSEPVDLLLIGPFKAHTTPDVTCAENAKLPDGGSDAPAPPPPRT